VTGDLSGGHLHDDAAAMETADSSGGKMSGEGLSGSNHPSPVEDRAEMRHQSKKTSGEFEKASFHHYPFYSPRFWHGMRPGSWWNLLRQGRFRIHPSRLPMIFAISFATLLNTLLAVLQSIIFRLYRGPLAERNDSVARTDGSRRKIEQPLNISVFCTLSLSGFGVVFSSFCQLADTG
jgi:hypothetical protein